MTKEEKIAICQMRDKKYDDKFFLCVKSTKIVCYPSCPTKVPLAQNMEFYNTLKDEIVAGYRPCKICLKTMEK